MAMSEDKENVTRALVAAQAACKVPGKGHTAGSGARSWKYADLNDVKKAYEKAAQANGLAISDDVVPITDAAAQFWLVTTVTHISGEFITTKCPLLWDSSGIPMQKYGSAETYARRYNRLKLFDLIPSDDRIEQDGRFTGPEDHTQAQPYPTHQQQQQAPQQQQQQHQGWGQQQRQAGPPQPNPSPQRDYSRTNGRHH